VLDAVSRGEIRPVIDQTLPWTRHEEAAARLLGGEARGKVVLTLDDAR
jgi:NADPH:quinone reductase-like Zn-dependent oxidoreductase